jgi:hypothetical protein
MMSKFWSPALASLSLSVGCVLHRSLAQNPNQ